VCGVVVVNEVPDSPDVVFKFLGEGQSFSNQARDPLPQGIVETLDVIGQARCFTDLMQGFVIEDSIIDFLEVSVGLSV
jgi:hypothetical protein